MKTTLKRKPRGQTYFLSLILILLIFLSGEARAELFEFFAPISENSGEEYSVAAQLSVDVTEYGWGQVSFEFLNAVSSDPDWDYAGVITSVYFDDGALLGLSNVINSPPDVEFTAFDPLATPTFPDSKDLDPSWETTAGFGADANPPSPDYGVNPGESLQIVFNLVTTYDAVIAALDVGFNPDEYYVGGVWTQPSLRIGMHVQNIGPDGEFSDSFILTPVPGAAILGLLGLGMAGIKLRRFA